jgi:ATP/maltotriose-dependent transcriptional regulator MalT
VAEAKKSAHKIGTPQDLRYAAIAAAILAQAKADHAGMAEALRLVRYIEPGVAGPHTWWQTWWLPLLVEALIGVGALDEAERKPRQLQYSLQDVSNVADTTCLLRATLARTQGRTEQALLIYQRHVDSTRDQPHLPFPRARLEHDYGNLLLITGERGAARGWLQSATERFAALAAAPLLQRVEKDLDAASIERPAQLTTELYVTVKTVEYHLSNIYAKLGINSRRKLRSILDDRRPASSG